MKSRDWDLPEVQAPSSNPTRRCPPSALPLLPPAANTVRIMHFKSKMSSAPCIDCLSIHRRYSIYSTPTHTHALMLRTTDTFYLILFPPYRVFISIFFNLWPSLLAMAINIYYLRVTCWRTEGNECWLTRGREWGPDWPGLLYYSAGWVQVAAYVMV